MGRAKVQTYEGKMELQRIYRLSNPGRQQRQAKARDAREIASTKKCLDEEYFYSLCRPHNKSVTRRCMKCRQDFKSVNGNYICATCQIINARVGVNAMAVSNG